MVDSRKTYFLENVVEEIRSLIMVDLLEISLDLDAIDIRLSET